MAAITESKLERDAKAAAGRGMKFRVSRKERRAGKWETVVADIAELSDAMARAKEQDAFEAAVFTDGPGRLAGFLYWTSSAPELLNSTVITQVVL